MSYVYKVTHSDLVSVADAIRERAQTSDPLVFPNEFVTAINNLGGSGATLTVNTLAEGITVTVTNGELNYTKNTGADGTAVFYGLETGTWTITISDGSKTATKTVDIDADYYSTITLFASTINVTYPAGLVCTVTDGVITLTAPDTSGTWACVVHNAGTWTVSLDSGFSESVDITQDGEVQTVDKWYLYHIGDQRSNITGGWNSNGVKSGFSGVSVVSGTLASDRIKIYGAESTETILMTESRIDFRGFTKLVANCNVISTYQPYSAMNFAIRDVKNNTKVSDFVAGVETNGTGSQTLNLTIGSIDSGYVQVNCGGVPEYKTDVFSIYLE